jgi:hypothetical protein
VSGNFTLACSVAVVSNGESQQCRSFESNVVVTLDPNAFNDTGWRMKRSSTLPPSAPVFANANSHETFPEFSFELGGATQALPLSITTAPYRRSRWPAGIGRRRRGDPTVLGESTLVKERIRVTPRSGKEFSVDLCGILHVKRLTSSHSRRVPAQFSTSHCGAPPPKGFVATRSSTRSRDNGFPIEIEEAAGWRRAGTWLSALDRQSVFGTRRTQTADLDTSRSLRQSASWRPRGFREVSGNLTLCPALSSDIRDARNSVRKDDDFRAGRRPAGCLLICHLRLTA